MTFKLSNRSLGKLEGVYPDLVATVKRAIEITEVDFGVTAGVRDLETQKKLVQQGRSQTLKSRHLIQDDGYSWAVDLLAYDQDGDVCWEHNMYWKIGDAMITAAKEVGMDPAEFRRINFIPKDAFPYQTQVALQYDIGDYEPHLDKAMEMIDYSNFEKRRAEAAKRGMYRGIGMSSYIEACGLAPSAVVG